MFPISKSDHKRSLGGFTLIELLVVIAIIGILASVVLASLNSARTKGTIASIKSNLKNIIPQAELTYDVPGNYSLVCTDTKVASMLAAITNGNTVAKCYSNNDAAKSDVNLRYGASAVIGISTPIQAYSVSSTNVDTWDVKGVDTSGAFVSSDVTMTWDQATAACSIAGGRLPTLEELKSLSDASYAASGNASYSPPSFVGSFYWSSTIVPSTPANAYAVHTAIGVIGGSVKTSGFYARCVR